MADVGFYHLTRWPLERALPKLLERVLAADHKVVLLAPSMERVEDLTGLLWTYDPGSWMPHGSARDGNAAAQPVYLTDKEEAPNGANVLVVIEGMHPGFAGQFERVVDLFNGHDEEAVKAARTRWKAYQAAGHALTYWQQTDSGGWQKRQ